MVYWSFIGVGGKNDFCTLKHGHNSESFMLNTDLGHESQCKNTPYEVVRVDR